MDYIKKHRYALLAPPIALAIFLLLSTTGVFQKLEYLSVDWRYALRSDNDPQQHEDLVIVGVDEPCLKVYGRWPWDRNAHGDFLSLLSHKDPKVVAFDFLFVEPDKAEFDQLFGKGMEGIDSVITGAMSEEDKAITQSFDRLSNASTNRAILEGLNDFIVVLKRWFIYDQLLGKSIEASRDAPAAIFQNIEGAFEQAMETKTEEEAVEMIKGIIGFFGELAQNKNIKPVAANVQNADNVNDLKDTVIEFLYEFTTPAGNLGPTQNITNIKGDTAKVDKGSFGVFPVRELIKNGYIGFVNSEPNQIDGIRRKLPMLVKSGNHYFPSLVAQMVMRFHNVSADNVEVILGEKIIFKGEKKTVEVPIDDGAYYYVNYRKMENFLNYPYSILARGIAREVHQGEEWPENYPKLEGKVLLLGQFAAGLSDLGPLPNVAKAPLMLVHGNAFNNILMNDYAKFFPTKPIIVGWLILAWGSLLLLNGRSILPSVITPAIVIIVYSVAAFVLFKNQSLHLPFFWPILSFFAIHFGSNIISWWEDYKMRDNIKGMFGTYISADLVDQMIESGEEPKLGGVDTEITAFFSDVQSFSVFSELLTSPQLVDLMNEYLTAMTDILQDEKGTLDKYIGDAIVAMYGAPLPLEDHAHRAIRTCVRVYHRQGELREKWAAEGDKWPSVVPKMQTRMGCNTGIATVGNMGAENRFNYTMMGDMVNLAARCESGAKAYGAYIMVTEESYQASKAFKDDIQFRYLDKIIVKGRSIPVAMYEVLGMKSEISQEVQDCLEIYNNAIEQYLAQDFKKAHELFVKAQDFELHRPGITPNVKDNPSIIMAERCTTMFDRPFEEGWDGVYVMTSK